MKRFTKIAAFALAAIMTVGVVSTADVQAAKDSSEGTVTSTTTTYALEDVQISPKEGDINKEFSPYYIDLEYQMTDGVLTGIKATSGFGPVAKENQNAGYTMKALSQLADWLQTSTTINDLANVDIYSGATSSLGSIGNVHVPEFMTETPWERVADSITLTVVLNSVEYTSEGPSAITTQYVYTGTVAEGEFKFIEKGNISKVSEGTIKKARTGEAEPAGGELDEYITVEYLGEKDGWRSYQINKAIDETKYINESVGFFFYNYSRYGYADSINNEYITYDEETGIISVNMNSAQALEEKYEVAGGLTHARLQFKYEDPVKTEWNNKKGQEVPVTYTAYAYLDLTAELDNAGTGDNAGTTDNSGTTNNAGTTDGSTTTTTSPKTGDEAGSMYLVLAAGLAVAIVAASRAGRRARA